MFRGGGRVFKTNLCYDQMPTLQRETHTRSPSGREWRTRCTTPADDPRHAVMNTLVVATTDTHIDVVETGRYESQLAGGLCTADIKRSRSFDLVARAGAAAPLPHPPPPRLRPRRTARSPRPSRPTRPPARRPATRRASKHARRASCFVPARSLSFRAIVLDSAGAARRTPTTWTVNAAASRAISVDASGKVSVAADAPEGSFGVIVSAAGKSTRVTVEVASTGRYDALLQQSGLNDAGENDTASVVMIAAAQIGGGNARAEDGSHRRRAIFLAIIGALALGLGALAVAGARRSRRAAAIEREAQERYAQKVEAAAARRLEKVALHAAAMRAHEESLEQAKRAVAESATAGPAPMVCPACQREYAPGSAFCPHDASKLVPLNAARAASPGRAAASARPASGATTRA